MTEKKENMKPVPVKLSPQTIKALDILGDVYACPRSELIRNFMEDVLRGLSEGVLELTVARHIKIVEKKVET